MRRLAIVVLVVLAACSPQTGRPTYGVSGRATAGPTCPVVPASPLPGQCDPEPVGRATIVVTDSAGTRVASVTTAADGSFVVDLPEGSYVLVPSPVAGILGTARSVPFDVSATEPAPTLEVSYDTGIR